MQWKVFHAFRQDKQYAPTSWRDGKLRLHCQQVIDLVATCHRQNSL